MRNIVDFYQKVGRTSEVTHWQGRLDDVSKAMAAASSRTSAQTSAATATKPRPPALKFVEDGDHARSELEFAPAIAAYQEATRLDPSLSRIWNSLAWLYATAPKASARDGKAAVAAAQKACELTNWGNATYLDTLAAAYAEAGEFDRAVEFQQKALDLVAADHVERKEWQSRLALYRERKPYRQPERMPASTAK